MILLVTTSARGRECAAALDCGTGHKTQVAATVPQALGHMQTAEYEVLAIDQSLLEADLRALDTLLNHAGVAVPLYVNLALHSGERVAREAQAALERAVKEKRAALQCVERELRNLLRSEITGILLTSQLALRNSALPADVVTKLQLMHEMAEKMRTQLHVV